MAVIFSTVQKLHCIHQNKAGFFTYLPDVVPAYVTALSASQTSHLIPNYVAIVTYGTVLCGPAVHY